MENRFSNLSFCMLRFMILKKLLNIAILQILPLNTAAREKKDHGPE